MTIIRRGEVTDALITVLEGTGKPVGDSMGADKGGWQGEGFNTGTFVPYVVVIPQPTTRPTATFSDTETGWIVVYALTSFGVSRTQCEWMADEARAQAQGLVGQTFTFGSKVWRVKNVFDQMIGAVSRIDEPQPSFFSQVDAIGIRLEMDLG